MPRRRVFTSRCGVISPQHVTLLSWILIRQPADERWATGLHRKIHRHHQWNHHLNRLNIIETIFGIIIETIIGTIIETTSISSAESTPQSSNDQRTIYRSPRQRVNDHPHKRSVERVVAMEPRAIRRASRHHGTANDPLSESSPPSRK